MKARPTDAICERDLRAAAIFMALSGSLISSPSHADNGWTPSGTVGLGVVVAPEFPGSDEYETSPIPLVSLRLGRFYADTANGIGVDVISTSSGRLGIGVGYEPGRDTSDSAPGLRDLDAGAAAIIVGETIWGPVKSHARLTAPISGDVDGFSVEFGALWGLRPSDKVFMAAGPRLILGSEDYMGSLFTVTAAESAATGFTACDAGAGLVSAGIAGFIDYAVTQNFGVRLFASADSLLGDAGEAGFVDAEGADFPITVGAGVVYRLP